jgi:predicted nucleic acid-binding protein
MNAVDTNIFVYSLDANEPDKQAKAKLLLGGLVGARPRTILPWQVAWELLNWLRKWELQGRVSKGDVEAHFRDILAMFPLAIPGAQVFATYFGLRSRFSLSHWDSMLLAACSLRFGRLDNDRGSTVASKHGETPCIRGDHDSQLLP